jgi:hypothetical protein
MGQNAGVTAYYEGMSAPLNCAAGQYITLVDGMLECEDPNPPCASIDCGIFLLLGLVMGVLLGQFLRWLSS